MPQSLANLLVHLVFSTRGRDPLITQAVREDLNRYATGIFKNLGCPLVQIGSVEDHVHVLFNLSRTQTLANVVEKVKTGTSKWMKTHGDVWSGFAWQAGYGAFSVSPDDASKVISYIKLQPDHHKKLSFQDELRELLREAGLEWDERYVWD